MSTEIENVRFVWSPVSGASHYQLETRSDREGQMDWNAWNTSPGTEFIIAFDPHGTYFHTPGTVYYWRVAAVDVNGRLGAYSDVWAFIFQREWERSATKTPVIDE